MAIGATPVEVLDGTKGLRLRRVAAGDVAGVANPGHTHLQQLWVAAAVWFVTVGTILHDRGMLPKEWSPAFGMAAVAVLVDGALKQLARIRTTVRIVTARAGDLTLAIRHVRGTLQLCAAHLMALQAKFRLRLLGSDVLSERSAIARFRRERRVALGRAAIVHLVTRHAGHAP